MLIAKFFAHSSQKEVVQLTALCCATLKRIYVVPYDVADCSRGIKSRKKL